MLEAAVYDIQVQGGVGGLKQLRMFQSSRVELIGLKHLRNELPEFKGVVELKQLRMMFWV